MSCKQVIKVKQFHYKPLSIPLSYLRADNHKQAITHIWESRWFESMYTLQGKPDQHATRIPRSVRIWSQTIGISHGQRIATFCEPLTDLDGSHHSWEKGIPNNIPSMPADRFAGPHLVSLLLSAKEVVGLSQASIDSGLLGLPSSYHWHAIGTFNTCSQGPTHRSLTDTGGGYNHLRAPSGLRLSNLKIASSEMVMWNTYCRPMLFWPLNVYRSLYLCLAILRSSKYW
jgi:hypothetical protein